MTKPKKLKEYEVRKKVVTFRGRKVELRQVGEQPIRFRILDKKKQEDKTED